MGLTRKLVSVSTLGLVNYNSKRDLQKQLLKEEAKMVKAQRKSLDTKGK